MTRMVIAPVFLLAAMVSPEARPSPPALERVAVFKPTGQVTARATASVRIVSAARFGHGKSGDEPGATRRTVRLVDRDGAISPAELLEFQ